MDCWSLIYHRVISITAAVWLWSGILALEKNEVRLLPYFTSSNLCTILNPKEGRLLSRSAYTFAEPKCECLVQVHTQNIRLREEKLFLSLTLTINVFVIFHWSLALFSTHHTTWPVSLTVYIYWKRKGLLSTIHYHKIIKIHRIMYFSIHVRSILYLHVIFIPSLFNACLWTCWYLY